MRKMTEIEFIGKSVLKHKGAIDYSKMEFVNARTPVVLTCSRLDSKLYTVSSAC